MPQTHALVSNVDDVLKSLDSRFNPDACQDLEMAVHWKLTGTENRAFTIFVDKGSFRLEQGPNENADVTLEAPSDVYLKLVNGQMKGLFAVMTRKLKVSGNIQLTTRWDRCFS